MSEIKKIKRITDSINEAKESKNKSDDAQRLLSDFFKKKNSKDLNKAFELIGEANKLNPKSIEPYLALSCLYYMKKKKEVSLGILYKAREYNRNDNHLNKLISDIEEELVNILIQKEKNRSLKNSKK